VAVELVAGLVWDLGVVFATFAEDVGANVQGGTLFATRVKKEMTAVVCVITVPGT
jgi:hypothetical protein